MASVALIGPDGAGKTTVARMLEGCTHLDRHFLFDFAAEITAGRKETLERKLHRRSQAYLYPRPDLVIFLDAPGEVLFARKGELTVDELERRRQAFLRQGEKLPNFIRLDATRPLTEVHDEVLSLILRGRGHGQPLVPAEAP